MALIWTKQLSVGNATLDAEHKDLISMVNSIEYAVETRDCSYLLLSIKRFMECVHAHFENEERFAQAINLPFDRHELAHRHLRNELQHTRDQLEAQNGVWPEYMMDYYPQLLMEWLAEHVAGDDMQMKLPLLAYPYDFKPG